MKWLRSYYNDFTALLFPDLCGACGKNLFKGEVELCTSCIYHLPRTTFHQDPQNKVARQFWGRVPLVQAGAFLHFQKGTRVQQLMHQLKYNKRQNLGRRLGELYGLELAESDTFIIPDLIIPVPLHPKKLRKRGYNQSKAIAEGLGKVLGVPASELYLKRSVYTDTQTKRSRFARYENMQLAFEISHADELHNKHILLVDDVITTGSTLEACALNLQKNATLSISIAALAYAD
ncbi:MAG: ComF family protein [Sphingobacteriaceae bacterium]